MARHLPPVTFMPWSAWGQRRALSCSEQPGVYLLAFRVKLGQPVDPTDPRIIYIGRTSRPLKERWREFERAAGGSPGGHSGGNAFFIRSRQRPLAELRVAAWAPAVEDATLRDAYAHFAERLLILEWVKKHGTLPLCNSE